MHFTYTTMLKVSPFLLFLCKIRQLNTTNLIPVSARKSLQSQVPIILSDNDIEKLAVGIDDTINSILDVFIKTRSESMHVLRAIEPNLRFGTIIRKFINKSKNIPLCQYWNTDKADKCIHMASRKNIGDTLVRYEMAATNAGNKKSKT